MRQDHEENVQQTYYGLRLALFVLALMLFVSVVIQAIAGQCMQGSLSAYYYTPARPIFIATLCAIGACLIIYRGNTRTENGLLDFAGFLAFIVAFVPTKAPAAVPPTDGSCAATNLPTDTDISSAVVNNVWSLFAAGVLATLLSRFLKPHYLGDRRFAAPTKWSLSASLVSLILGAGFFVLDYQRFAGSAHFTAAVLFFAVTLWVVAVNAAGAREPYRRIYWSLFGATLGLLALVVILNAAIELRTWVFWVETVGILGFAAFWLIQTKELGGFVDREAKSGATL